MPNTAEPPATPPSTPAPLSSPASPRQSGLLVKIETDRRLGHEWDEWNGQPLPNAGDFRTSTGKYFLFTSLGLAGIVIIGAAAIYLLTPRLAQLGTWLPRALYLGDALLGAVGAVWLALIGLSYATNR